MNSFLNNSEANDHTIFIQTTEWSVISTIIGLKIVMERRVSTPNERTINNNIQVTNILDFHVLCMSFVTNERKVNIASRTCLIVIYSNKQWKCYCVWKAFAKVVALKYLWILDIHQGLDLQFEIRELTYTQGANIASQGYQHRDKKREFSDRADGRDKSRPNSAPYHVLVCTGEIDVRRQRVRSYRCFAKKQDAFRATARSTKNRLRGPLVVAWKTTSSVFRGAQDKCMVCLLSFQTGHISSRLPRLKLGPL